jgi:FkbM family methyltransferase
MDKPPIKNILQIDLPRVEVVDIGAMAEGRDRYAGLVEQGLANVTGFEPDADQFRKLCSIKQGPYRYLPYFLGDGGPATFHIARYPGCSSLYAPDPQVIDLFTAIGTGQGGNFRIVRTVDVQTKRWDDVAECPRANYVKLDVQGAELDILRHGTRALENAVVLEVEVEFLPLYRKQPLFGDVQVFLAGQGFVLHKLVDVAGRSFRPLRLDGNEYAAISQVLWADAIFVRDFTRLERFSGEQLLMAVGILHEVYCSYDLAFYLLQEYDRRLNTDLALRYTEGVLRQPGLPVMYLNLKLHT